MSVGLGALLSLALKALPILLNWIREAQREGLLKEGERRLLAKQVVAYAQELELWSDIQEEVRNTSDSDLRDLLTGRVPARPGETQRAKPK